jgi:DNA-damage-inducible protein D
MKTIFEQIKQVNQDGVEYWDARDLAKHLGYDRFDSFKRLVMRIKIELEEETQLHNHVELHKIKTNSPNKKETFYLSRLACYKISMLSSTPEGVKARSYFAVQTRRQELADLRALYGPDLERIEARRKLTKTEKELSELLHQNHLTGAEI